MTKCILCRTTLQPTIVKHRGESFEAMRCPTCREAIFTEKQAIKALKTLEAMRLQKNYVKKPLRIGRSIGITFPKDVATTFRLDRPDTKLKIVPNLARNRIEIEVD